MFRTQIERMTHPVVLRRRLPAPFGSATIYASTEGGLRYLRPRLTQVDPVLLQLVQELIISGSTVWDVGANLGLFSFAAAVNAGPNGYVLAIEPDIRLAGLLQRSSSVNRGHAPVEIVPVAAAHDIGVARFHIASRNRATNHLDGFGTSQTGGTRFTQLVPTITLDCLMGIFPPPDLLKIDVEEAEVGVLTGAANVLKVCPKVICEVAAKNSAEVTTILTGHKYTLYDGNEPAQTRVPVSEARPNTVAIRKSEVLRLAEMGPS